MQRASDLLLGVSINAPPIEAKIIDFVHSAMDELTKVGVAGKPIWQPNEESRYETLNEIEYLTHFGPVDATLREIVKLVEVGEPQKTNVGELQVESSRDMAYINMFPISIVELLMDVNQWSRAFHNIVSRTTLLGTFSVGVEGGYDGTLHVMSAEFHLPTPVIPTRECYFARYCKQLSHDHWGVVDVSLEKHFPSPSHNNFRKRPSGCLIKRMPSGFSKVIWVEHVEADHSQINNLFKPLVTGFAFGATRWLASIVRYSDTLEAMKAAKFVADDGVNIPQAGRTGFLKLADRMMRNFCANVSGTTSNPWMRLAPLMPCSIDVRIMVDNNMEETPNKPRGRMVVFTTTLFVNVDPIRLFNFLRHEKSRTKWDVLSRSLCIREFACMVKGQHPENRVSLLRASTAKNETEIFYLQESYTDSTVAYVIYAPLDESALTCLAKGSNPDDVIAFPSGFSITPGALTRNGEGNNNAAGSGSLLTVAFNLIDKANDNPFIPIESFQTINGIITETVTSIRDAMDYHTRLDNWMTD